MFCRNCGKELCEKAYVCPACGVLVGKKPTVMTEEKVVERAQEEITIGGISKETKRAKLFGIVAFILICITFIFIFIGISQGFVSSYGDFNFYNWATITGWIISSAALVFGVIALINALNQKEYVVNYISTLIFIASITAFLIPLCILIF